MTPRYRSACEDLDEGCELIAVRPVEEALRLAEFGYLLPLIRWAASLPEHAAHGGRNFFLVFAMDLGRQDFPSANKLLWNWGVGS